jgi:ferredoxin
MESGCSEYRIDGDLSRGEVPEDLEDCVRQAAEGCPVEIIHIEE